jgi:glutathione S-transferase
MVGKVGAAHNELRNSRVEFHRPNDLQPSLRNIVVHQCETCAMTFTLYNAPQSTCSQRVRFVLNAKTIPFGEIKLDLLAGDQLKPDYLALNPNGVVPTLDHDGAIVTDSSVIIEYLDEIAPEPATFTPENPVLRARMRALMHFIDEMPAPAVRVPTFNLAFLPRFAAMSEDTFKAFAESKPLRREFMLAMGRTGFPQKDMDEALARLRRTYERMDAEIAKSGGPWLLGGDISLADVMLMPAIVRMADLGRAGDWRDLPRVERWYEAIAAHPAFAPTYYPGSLLTERFPHLRETLGTL